MFVRAQIMECRFKCRFAYSDVSSTQGPYYQVIMVDFDNTKRRTPLLIRGSEIPANSNTIPYPFDIYSTRLANCSFHLPPILSLTRMRFAQKLNASPYFPNLPPMDTSNLRIRVIQHSQQCPFCSPVSGKL